MWQVTRVWRSWRVPSVWITRPVRVQAGGARPAIAGPQVYVITSAAHRARAIQRRP